MTKTTVSYFAAAMLLLFLAGFPQGLFAAELSFQPILSAGSSTPTVIEVRIDPQAKRLNVVEGVIRFSGEPSDDLFVEVENGQSILPIWPTPPQYNKDKKSISFTGGIPNGFDSPGLLFRVRISSAVSGDVTVSYSDGNAYLNDGKGTTEAVDSKPITVHVDKTLENAKTKASSGYGTYVIILLSILVVLIVIFKYGFKKNDK